MGVHNMNDKLADRAGEFDAAVVRLFWNARTGGHMIGWGDVPPSDGLTGWSKGALFLQTDGSALNTIIYLNIGDSTSCDFDAAVCT